MKSQNLTDKLILRVPVRIQDFLAYEANRVGESQSTVVRYLITRSKEWAAWERHQHRLARAEEKYQDAENARAAREERCALADEIRNETRARRTQTQQERDARKAAKEQACHEQERADLLYELSLYRDRAGIYASHPKTKERYTWREYLADRWSSDPDISHYRATHKEEFDQDTRKLKDDYENTYLRAGLLPPSMPDRFFEPLIPRCQHWLPLEARCLECLADEEVAGFDAWRARQQA